MTQNFNDSANRPLGRCINYIVTPFPPLILDIRLCLLNKVRVHSIDVKRLNVLFMPHFRV